MLDVKSCLRLCAMNFKWPNSWGLPVNLFDDWRATMRCSLFCNEECSVMGKNLTGAKSQMCKCKLDLIWYDAMPCRALSPHHTYKLCPGKSLASCWWHFQNTYNLSVAYGDRQHSTVAWRF